MTFAAIVFSSCYILLTFAFWFCFVGLEEPDDIPFSRSGLAIRISRRSGSFAVSSVVEPSGFCQMSPFLTVFLNESFMPLSSPPDILPDPLFPWWYVFRVLFAVGGKLLHINIRTGKDF